MTREPLADDEIRIGAYWNGRLDEWLAELEAGSPHVDPSAAIHTWSFPTDELRDEYLASIKTRDDRQIRTLLEYFLFDPSTFGADRSALDHLLSDKDHFEYATARSEYHRRLLRTIGGRAVAHPGVRWVLDILPDSPRRAITVINAYLGAHIWVMSDGRIDGMFDAVSLIRAAYIERDIANGLDVLLEVSPREFEVLVANLYKQLGYEVELTPPTDDGGRDIIARRQQPGEDYILLVECKLYRGTVGVRYARALLGVVSDEKRSAGVIVTSGSVSRGVRSLAEANGRISYVEGSALIPLMNAEFGPDWPSKLDSLVTRIRHQ